VELLARWEDANNRFEVHSSEYVRLKERATSRNIVVCDLTTLRGNNEVFAKCRLDPSDMVRGPDCQETSRAQRS